MCVCARPGGSRSIGRNPDVPGVVRWRGCVAGCLPAVDVCDGVVLRTSFVFTAGETFIDCKLGVCVCREVSSRLTCLCLSVEPHCESVHFIHYKTYRTSPLDAAASMCSVRCRRCGVLPWRLSPGVGTLQALREVGGHHLDNLILFVHGAGNLIFGHAADSNLCKPGAGSYWFEVQVGCCVLCAASRAVVVPHDMDSLCVLCVCGHAFAPAERPPPVCTGGLGQAFLPSRIRTHVVASAWRKQRPRGWGWPPHRTFRQVRGDIPFLHGR